MYEVDELGVESSTQEYPRMHMLLWKMKSLRRKTVSGDIDMVADLPREVYI